MFGELFTRNMSVDWMPDWVRVVILCYAAAYLFLMVYTAVRLGERYWKPLVHPPHAERSLRPPVLH